MTAFQIEDLPIESQMLTNALDEAQRKVESYFFDIRKQLFEYDQVLNTQRDRVYADRRAALEAPDLEPLLVEYADRTVDDILEVGFSLFLSLFYCCRRRSFLLLKKGCSNTCLADMSVFVFCCVVLFQPSSLAA
jgi:hypothetical protein